MGNYINRDYALNKRSNSIVYDFADETAEVTVKDFLSAAPGATEADFAFLKKLSDEDYRKSDLDTHNKTYLDISIEWAESSGLCFCMSAEDRLIENFETSEVARKRADKLHLANLALSKLTSVQRRRFDQFYIGKKSMREIAFLEGVNHSKIQKSLNEANKKIKKFLSGS